MASADENSQNGGNGSGQRQHTIHIPIPRNLPPGQRYTIRVNMPGQAVQGQVGAQQVPIRLVNLRGVQGQSVTLGPGGVQGAAGINPILQQLQQQQRERMEREEEQKELREREERARREDKLRKERLKNMLGYTEPLNVDFDKKETEAALDWPVKRLEVPGITEEVMYTVKYYCDDKPASKDIYCDMDNSCTVCSDVLTLGHTHHFTVIASVGEINGDPSPKSSLTIPALPPSTPLPPKIASRTKNTLTLRWNASQDNGSPITQYELEWDQCRDEWEQLVCDKAKQFKLNRKFPPASHAQFRVRASNAIGTSLFSEILHFSSGAGPPSVPKPPSMTEAGIRHVALQWTPPPSNGADITSYSLEMEYPESGYGYRPVYQGEDAFFTCTGLERVTGYNFRVAASNEKGTSSTSPSVMYHTLPSVPGPPAAPYLKERSTGGVLKIAWQEPPDNGGAGIQTYVLEMGGGGGGGGGEMEEVYMGPDKWYLAERVQPGKKYQARVCGISVAGHGQWSPLAEFSTPAVCPSPPLCVSVVGIPTQTTITIQWSFPLTDGGAAITSYSLELNLVSDTTTEWSTAATVPDPRTFSEPSSPLSSLQSTPIQSVTNLMPGTQYHFRITCCNAVGTSAPSVECSGLTAPGHPDPPSEFEVSGISATSALLNWKVSSYHGSSVDSYELQWFAERQSHQVLSSSSLTNQSSLRNLTPATSYQTRVKALSSAGGSDWSLPVTFSTATAAPSASSHTNLISRAPYSLLIAWNTPCDNGSPIIAYYIEVGVESGHMTSLVIHVDATETQHTIPDLKPNTTYRFRVQAENGVGRGLFGSYGSGTTLPPPPSPPHLTLSSCSPNILKVVWGRKQSRNISYVLHLSSLGNRFHEVYDGNAISYRITRLLPDTEYTLKIAAISESGQGDWSDHVTFMTTPTPPTAPKDDLVLMQVSDSALELAWQPEEYSHPLIYEAQYRVANINQDYQQCYMGPATNSQFTLSKRPTTSTVVYEARVRSCATCTVNGHSEQLWSNYSPSVLCCWEKKESREVLTQEEEEKEKEKSRETVAANWVSGWTVGVLLFAVVALLAIIAALLLGKIAV